MKSYKVSILEQAHKSLEVIVKHKIEYSDKASVKRFADGFYEDTETLSILPHRGLNLSNARKAIIYKSHLIIYQIIEPDKVIILDIIDPRQDSIANKYY